MTQQPETKPESIRCENCGHDNLPDAKICIICDAPLTKSRFRTERKRPSGLLPPTAEERRQAKLEEERQREEEERRQAEEAQRLAEEKRRTDEMAELAATVKTSTQCPDCGFSNRIGDLFCQECGASLSPAPKQEAPADITQEMQTLTLKDLQAEIERRKAAGADAFNQTQPPASPPVQPPPASVPSASPQPVAPTPTVKSIEDGDIPDGAFQFTDEMFLRFTDLESQRYTEVTPSKDKPLLIGRSHESLPVQPDVDFTPFLVEQHGVSRRHALVRLRDLRLEMQDLNSTNGTSINGFRFRPKETHQLRSGDVITLGRVSVRVDYMRKKAPQSGNVTDVLDG